MKIEHQWLKRNTWTLVQKERYANHVCLCVIVIKTVSHISACVPFYFQMCRYLLIKRWYSRGVFWNVFVTVSYSHKTNDTWVLLNFYFSVTEVWRDMAVWLCWPVPWLLRQVAHLTHLLLDKMATWFFYMNFREWKYLYFGQTFTDFHS